MDESTAQSRHRDSMRQACLWALLSTLVLVLIAPSVGDAQVTTSITSTTGAGNLGTTVTQAGNVYDITGGTRPGNGSNLFHSFGEFSVGANNIANFLNETALPTSNILSRVTGGNPSNIFGTLQTTNFGAANLFLINPAGVIFGPNVQLNVGGSFVASTADYLMMADGARFHADPVKSTVLSVAPVAAFGFLSPEPPAPIVVQGSTIQVPEGHALSLVGGDIIAQAGSFEDGTIQAALLRAPGGQLNLVSVASPGEVLVPSLQTGPNIEGASFTTRGTVTLKEGATLDVSGQNSGTVLVRGGQLVMDASTLLATTAVDGASTAVDIQLSQDIALSNGALISAGTSGLGRGGDVVIAAGNVQLNANSAIITQTSGPGRSGDVHVTADRLTLENGSEIITRALFGGGAGGDLFLNVGTLLLLNEAQINSGNFTGEDLDGDGKADVSGVGGDMTIEGIQGAGSAADLVLLSGNSAVSSITTVSEAGGRISIAAKSLVLAEASTVSSATSGAFDGGDIVLSVGEASLSGGATIASNTDFTDPDPVAAPAGRVTVQGLQGAGSMADSVELTGFGSGIVSASFGPAGPDGIEVQAKTVSLTDGAVIQAGDPFNSVGTPGPVIINADSVAISSGSRISSQAFGAFAGQVVITTNALTLDNGSIVTSTFSENGGRGGDVVLNGGTVSLTNGARINSQSETFSTGRAGDITITGESLTLANHSEITSSSKGIVADAGDAGIITIQSGSTVVMNDSTMTTEAIEASGGQIEINAPEMVRLTNSRISTSVKGFAGVSDSGNITIDPQFVILQNSQIIAQANAGSGGAINVIAGVFLADPISLLSASSEQGPQGTVNIQSPVQNVGGQLTPLPQQFSSAAGLLLASRCAADATGQFSSFVQTGREGVPQIPGALSPSPLSFLETLTSGSLGSPSPNWAAARLGLDFVGDPSLFRFHSTCRS